MMRIRAVHHLIFDEFSKFSNYYKLNLEEEKNNIYISITPKRPQPVSTTLGITLKCDLDNPLSFMAEIYLTTVSRDGDIYETHLKGKNIEKQFEGELTSGYPDEVICTKSWQVSDLAVFFINILRKYHEFESIRGPAKFNLHRIFEKGMDFLPEDVKYMIFDKIEHGHLRYVPGQFDRIGLHALDIVM